MAQVHENHDRSRSIAIIPDDPCYVNDVVPSAAEVML